MRLPALATALVLTASAALAGDVTVVDVRVRAEAGGSFRFDVTLAHADTGWDHYADRWDVVAPDGTVLGSRVLLHPHVDEQPFTRSLGGVRVPPGIATVTVRSHDKVHGPGGTEKTVSLPGR